MSSSMSMNISDKPSSKWVAVIGAGPAGLMAAETMASHGLEVHVYEAKPSAGRKFLMAGRGGLNITHSEPFESFVSRYPGREFVMRSAIEQFDADHLRQWVHGLGVETFVGSSGRVFPTEMKAAPLLRAWMHRLRQSGVRFHMRHRWLGWNEQQSLVFETPQGVQDAQPAGTVLACGGGSWAALGSDGAWVPWLKAKGIEVASLLPSNGGFEVAWSPVFVEKYAGQPIKNAAFAAGGNVAPIPDQWIRGECMATAYGLEGTAVYALSALLRDALIKTGASTLYVDLLPDKTQDQVELAMKRGRGARSMSTHLKSTLGLTGIKSGLLMEMARPDERSNPARLAQLIKALPIRLVACRPMDEAISTAGGVMFDGLTPSLMVRSMPGLFCAGEMLDWEAPTGGYLLNGCLALGKVAGKGVVSWLAAD